MDLWKLKVVFYAFVEKGNIFICFDVKLLQVALSNIADHLFGLQECHAAINHCRRIELRSSVAAQQFYSFSLFVSRFSIYSHWSLLITSLLFLTPLFILPQGLWFYLLSSSFLLLNICHNSKAKIATLLFMLIIHNLLG